VAPEGVADAARTGANPVTEAHLASIIESSQDAILSKDREGRITSWNPGAERMYGYSAEQILGEPVSILIPEHRAAEERKILERALAGEAVDHYESDRVHRDGHLVRVSLTVSPLIDERGEVTGASVIGRDVTGLHRSREFARRLHELTVALSGEITRKGTIERLLEHAVGGLGADAGTVGVLDPAGEEVVLAGAVGYTDEGIAGWQRFPLAADLPMSLAIRTGEAMWTESGDELRERFPPLAEADIRFDSLAVIPLAVEDKPFGAIALSFATEQRFDPETRTFMTTAAQQAAQSLDRARLYEDERAGTRRLSFLAAASELLAGSLDPDATLRSLAELAIREIADWCGIDLVDADRGVRNVATAHKDPERVQMANELRTRYPVDPDAPTGVPNVIRTGRPELYAEVPDELLVEAAVDEEHLRLIRELGLKSAMVVPLEARGRILGAMTLVASESGRRFNERDLELAGDLARRAALAIDNAMVFSREHEAAVTLQRALLPRSLPRVRGVEFAALYEPAAAGIEVGGDWYDVVALGEERVALTIGDIAGRGIEAASVMGRVAAALRAYVLDHQPPDEALRRLARTMRQIEGSQMATVLHLHVDVATGAAEYVRAGHPPALVRLPDGEIEELAGTGTPPIGILEDVDYKVHRATLPPGSMLLLYTDGLIERRDRDFEGELQQLRAALAEAPTDATECLRWLADRFSAETNPDDAALIAMSRNR
jgi:PAS domain S-box-containing protein